MVQNPRSARAVPLTFRLAALFTFLAVGMGALVCATGSGASCPTWPGCNPGGIAPHWQLSPIIEFSHRVVAVLAGPLVLAAAVLSARARRTDRAVRILPWVALACAVASGFFGRLVVLRGVPAWMGVIDLTAALTAMTVMAVAAVRASQLRSPDGVGSPDSVGTPDGVGTPGSVGAPDGDRTRAAGQPVSRLAFAGVLVLIAMHVTGILTAGTGSYTRCMGWPLWQLIGTDLHPGLQVLRLFLAGLATVLVATVAVLALRDARLRTAGSALAVLLAGELGLGLVLRVGTVNEALAAAHSALAVALLWCLALLAALAGQSGLPIRTAAPGQPIRTGAEPTRAGRAPATTSRPAAGGPPAP